MAATKIDISTWFDRGVNGGYKDRKCTHMIVVCDTYDYEDYPVYVYDDEDVQDKIKNSSGNMQRIMEVYNLSLDKDTQLNAWRVWNL